jgi:hypothetical protein
MAGVARGRPKWMTVLATPERSASIVLLLPALGPGSPGPFTDDLLLAAYCRARGGTTGNAVVQFCKRGAFPFLRAFFVTEN